MTYFRLHRWIALKISGLFLLVVTLACSMSLQPLATLSGEANPVTNGGDVSDIPSKVLTDVVATLFAPQQATFTAQIIEANSTNFPAQAKTPIAPTAGAALATSSIVPLPTTNQPAEPPVSFTAQTGKDINIAGMSLHNCGESYAANFLVENTGTQGLESISMQWMDLSTDQDISDPSVTNVPFMESDQTCSSGVINSLEPGNRLFIGGSLGQDQLSGHTILANFLFCTQDDLNGQCYPRSVEFVIP